MQFVPWQPAQEHPLGAALGRGVGAGINNLLNMKLQDVQRQKQLPAFQALGYNPQESLAIANMDPRTQNAFIKLRHGSATTKITPEMQQSIDYLVKQKGISPEGARESIINAVNGNKEMALFYITNELKGKEASAYAKGVSDLLGGENEKQQMQNNVTPGEQFGTTQETMPQSMTSQMVEPRISQNIPPSTTKSLFIPGEEPLEMQITPESNQAMEAIQPENDREQFNKSPGLKAVLAKIPDGTSFQTVQAIVKADTEKKKFDQKQELAKAKEEYQNKALDIKGRELKRKEKSFEYKQKLDGYAAGEAISDNYWKSLDSNYQSMFAQKPNIDKIVHLAQNGDIGPQFTNTITEFAGHLGLNLDWLRTADAAEIAKTSAGFLRGMGSAFGGGKVTNMEMGAYMKQFANLHQTPEQIELVANNWDVMYRQAKARYNAGLDIIKEHDGHRPADLQKQIEERVGKEVERIGNEWVPMRELIKQRYRVSRNEEGALTRGLRAIGFSEPIKPAGTEAMNLHKRHMQAIKEGRSKPEEMSWAEWNRLEKARKTGMPVEKPGWFEFLSR